MPKKDFWINECRRLGVKRTDTIVIYETDRIFAGPRASWMFRTYGATDVRILNGTLQKWIREDRPVETGPFKDIDDTSESGYDYEFSKTTYDSLQTILNKAYDLYRQKGQHNHLQIIDVRDPLSYRAGTIVGAMNDPYASYLNPEKTRFLSKEELQKMFKTNGIDISKSLSFS